MGFKRVIQTIIYLPRFISWVIMAGIMINILSIHGGLVNEIVELFGGTPQSFLLKPDYFRPIVTVSHIWKTAGWGSIIYLAALAGINVELYESAVIDGAGKLRQTWHVTLPGIRPAIILLFILSLADIMNAGFDQIFVLYNPLTLEVGDIIDTYVYRQGLPAARCGPAGSDSSRDACQYLGDLRSRALQGVLQHPRRGDGRADRSDVGGARHRFQSAEVHSRCGHRSRWRFPPPPPTLSLRHSARCTLPCLPN